MPADPTDRPGHLLMTVVFIPYPTAVFGEALRLGEGTRTAAVFYSAA